MARSELEVVQITSASARKLAPLREQIRDAGGMANLLIHPNYGEEDSGALFPMTTEYKAERDQLIAEALLRKTPLIVFEEKENMRRLPQKISGRGTLFVVPTWSGSPLPFVLLDGGVYFNKELSQEHKEAMAWNQVCLGLRQLGVQRVAMGGRYLAFRESRNSRDQVILNFLAHLAKAHNNTLTRELREKRLIPNYCVGMAILRMMECDFEVFILDASSPSNRLEPMDIQDR